MTTGETKIGIMVILSVIGMLAYISISQIYLIAGTDSNYNNVTVHEKWIKSQGEGGQKYLFSDQSGNVFSIEDSYWKWTFDASDRFAKIQENKTYDIKTYGRRSHWFSNYPNAISITEK